MLEFLLIIVLLLLVAPLALYATMWAIIGAGRLMYGVGWALVVLPVILVAAVARSAVDLIGLILRSVRARRPPPAELHGR